MKLEVQVISEEKVKPSAPIPADLHRYELSFLDQLAPPIYMPMVLFFPNCSDLTTQDLLNHLRTSLSEALTLYYPLAGVLNEAELCVDCGHIQENGGAYFVEARAHCDLSDVLDDVNPSDMNELLAVDLDDERVAELPAAVKVTCFACGGWAVSLCLNHRIVDALTFFMFINAWSAISRGEIADVKPPQFGAGKLFPAKELSGYTSNTGIIKNDIVTKRFVFEAAKIAELREKYDDKTSVEFTRRPTRVEALSSFIWHRLMAATEDRDGGDKNERVCTILHAVNLRTRTDPPLPENFFGNVSRIAISAPSLEPENGSYTIVSHVRDSIKKIDSEFVKKLREEEGHLSFLKRRLVQVTKGEVVSFSFTSLCRFPIYEADFGWGKPAFVGSARLTYKNLVSFFDTKSGDGIEAWVNLRTQDMLKFEADHQILAYVAHKSPKTV